MDMLLLLLSHFGRLQAENRALTRVVARLSEAVEGSDPQGL